MSARETPNVRVLSWEAVLAFRVRRQALTVRAPADAFPKTVADLCGVHAQLLSSAELSLAARSVGLERGRLQGELWNDRRLVKTWAMRGTLHLLPAAEYPLWQGALSTYEHYQKPSWLRNFAIERDQLEELLAAVGRALVDRHLTRDELTGEVERLTGSPSLAAKLGDSWGAYLKPASFRGHLCFAPNQGRNVAFTSPSSWLELGAEVAPAEALRETTRRYLAAYGPADRDEYARWWGLQSRPQAQRHIEALGDEVVEVEVGGGSRWALAADLDEISASGPERVVRLLPAFDPYVVAAPRNEPAVLDPACKARVYRAQGWLSPVLLVDGQIRGTWKHDSTSTRVRVEIQPFAAIPRWLRKAAEAEAERLARFLDRELELSWTAG